MYELIGYFLPDSLMAQADYIDGLLYLPAYELADYVLSLSMPLALLCVASVALLLSTLVLVGRFIYRYAKAKRT